MIQHEMFSIASEMGLNVAHGAVWFEHGFSMSPRDEWGNWYMEWPGDSTPLGRVTESDGRWVIALSGCWESGALVDTWGDALMFVADLDETMHRYVRARTRVVDETEPDA